MLLSSVADVFMKKEYYESAVRAHPSFELKNVAFFGNEDRAYMREVVHKIEVGGSESFEPPRELVDVISETEVLMVHICPVSEGLLKSAKKLKAILLNRGGVENVNVAAATALGIPVLSNPAHNANAVAEYTVGLIIALTRNIGLAFNGLKNGIWREKFPNSGSIYELSGMTVGLVGFGTIARLVTRKLSAFNVKFLVYDPFIRDDDPDLAEYNCLKVTLEELLSVSDVVSLHARASGDKPLLGERELSFMKPDAYLINTARAYLVDYDFLYKILYEGKIRGAAIDVFPSEPVSPDDRLFSLDNVLLTNHRGGDTVNSYSDSPAMLLCEVEKLFAGEYDKVKFWVNKKDLLA